MPDTLDAELLTLMHAIAAGDTAATLGLLGDSPALASAQLKKGASRDEADPYYLDQIGYYVYAGATALHVAAAAYQEEIVHELLRIGADVHAKDRRGAEPLHAAAVGVPSSPTWNPWAQAATIARLLKAGADPNAIDTSGVTALHRAARTRCAAAVKALLDGGADPTHKNKTGSTPLLLATLSTGRGGTGSPEAKGQQREILILLRQRTMMSES
jgi:ankyrin repeat protein